MPLSVRRYAIGLTILLQVLTPEIAHAQATKVPATGKAPKPITEAEFFSLLAIARNLDYAAGSVLSGFEVGDKDQFETSDAYLDKVVRHYTPMYKQWHTLIKRSFGPQNYAIAGVTSEALEYNADSQLMTAVYKYPTAAEAILQVQTSVKVPRTVAKNAYALWSTGEHSLQFRFLPNQRPYVEPLGCQTRLNGKTYTCRGPKETQLPQYLPGYVGSLDALAQEALIHMDLATLSQDGICCVGDVCTSSDTLSRVFETVEYAKYNLARDVDDSLYSLARAISYFVYRGPLVLREARSNRQALATVAKIILLHYDSLQKGATPTKILPEYCTMSDYADKYRPHRYLFDSPIKVVDVHASSYITEFWRERIADGDAGLVAAAIRMFVFAAQP